MTPKDLSPTERDLIVAKVIRHFSLDKSQMAELEKKGSGSPLLEEFKKEFFTIIDYLQTKGISSKEVDFAKSRIVGAESLLSLTDFVDIYKELHFSKRHEDSELRSLLDDFYAKILKAVFEEKSNEEFKVLDWNKIENTIEGLEPVLSSEGLYVKKLDLRGKFITRKPVRFPLKNMEISAYQITPGKDDPEHYKKQFEGKDVKYRIINIFGGEDTKKPAVQIKVYSNRDINTQINNKVLAEELVRSESLATYGYAIYEFAEEIEQVFASSALTPKGRMTIELNEDIVLNKEKLKRQIAMGIPLAKKIGSRIDKFNEKLKKSLGERIGEDVLANIEEECQVVSKVFVSTTGSGRFGFWESMDFELIAVPTEGVDSSDKYRIFLWNDVHGVILDFYIGEKILVSYASERVFEYYTNDDWRVLGTH